MTFTDCPVVAKAEWLPLIAKFANGSGHPHLGGLKDQGTAKSCNAFALASATEFSRSTLRLPDAVLNAAELFDRIPEPIGGSYMGTALEQAMLGFTPTGKVERVYYCPTFAHMMSAVLYGWPLAIYLQWYLSYHPDQYGWAHPAKGAAETHAVMGYKPAARHKNGSWEYGIWTQNSQGPKTERYMVLSEEMLTLPVGSAGAFAIALAS